MTTHPRGNWANRGIVLDIDSWKGLHRVKLELGVRYLHEAMAILIALYDTHKSETQGDGISTGDWETKGTILNTMRLAKEAAEQKLLEEEQGASANQDEELEQTKDIEPSEFFEERTRYTKTKYRKENQNDGAS